MRKNSGMLQRMQMNLKKVSRDLIDGGYQVLKFLKEVFQMKQENGCSIKRNVAIKFLKLPWPLMLKFFQKWRSQKPTSKLSPR